MRVLVTGSEGFVGRRVCALLEERGDDVYTVDSLEPRVHKGQYIPGVLWPRSAQTVPQEFLNRVDTVVHLAAQVGVADSMEDPERYIVDNTLDTALFLQKLPHNVKRIIVASSMSVYGAGGHLVKESHPVEPASVYGLTKYDQERLTLMWAKEHDVDAFALRFFNIYGPGQALDNPYTGVLANFSKRLLEGKPPIVFEDGQQTRDFIYIDDVAEAVVAALDVAPKATPFNEVLNVSTGVPTTIEHAARTLADALDVEVEPEITGTHRAGDIRHCTGSPERARYVLGWSPSYSFERGIARYAEWLQAAVT